MKSAIFKELFDSFSQLSKAIRRAKDAVKKDPEQTGLEDRLSEYERMLTSQKEYASSLYKHALEGDWTEVHRHIKIINHLSRMIRDDARAIISESVPAHDAEKELLQ